MVWLTSMFDYTLEELGVQKETKVIPEGTIKFDCKSFAEKGFYTPLHSSSVLHFVFDEYKKHNGNDPIKILEIGPALTEFLRYENQIKKDMEISSSQDENTDKDLVRLRDEQLKKLENDQKKYGVSTVEMLSSMPSIIGVGTDIDPLIKKLTWKNAKYSIGDFFHRNTIDDIKAKLGGVPDVIYGHLVFIEDLGKNQKFYEKEVSGNPDDLGERITAAAKELLNPGGKIIVCNGGEELSLPKFLPDILKDMKMTHFYLDTLTRVYEKSR